MGCCFVARIIYVRAGVGQKARALQLRLQFRLEQFLKLLQSGIAPISRRYSYASSGTQAQNRLRSPYTLSMRETGGQNLAALTQAAGKAACSRE